MIITDKIFLQISRITGWFEKEKCEWFEKCYAELSLNQYRGDFVAVEIGVFYGASAIAQGRIIKLLGLNCKLYAIDPWTAEACAEGTQDQANRDWWNAQDYNAALNSFTENIERYELQDIIEVVIGKSEEAVDSMPDEIDIVHIDGNHSVECSTNDVKMYLPKVRQGGIIFMDDFKWPHTQNAVEILKEHCDTLHEYDVNGRSWAVFKKR